MKLTSIQVALMFRIWESKYDWKSSVCDYHRQTVKNHPNLQPQVQGDGQLGIFSPQLSFWMSCFWDHMIPGGLYTTWDTNVFRFSVRFMTPRMFPPTPYQWGSLTGCSLLLELKAVDWFSWSILSGLEAAESPGLSKQNQWESIRDLRALGSPNQNWAFSSGCLC